MEVQATPKWLVLMSMHGDIRYKECADFTEAQYWADEYLKLAQRKFPLFTSFRPVLYKVEGKLS